MKKNTGHVATVYRTDLLIYRGGQRDGSESHSHDPAPFA